MGAFISVAMILHIIFYFIYINTKKPIQKTIIYFFIKCGQLLLIPTSMLIGRKIGLFNLNIVNPTEQDIMKQNIINMFLKIFTHWITFLILFLFILLSTFLYYFKEEEREKKQN